MNPSKENGSSHNSFPKRNKKPKSKVVKRKNPHTTFSSESGSRIRNATIKSSKSNVSVTHQSGVSNNSNSFGVKKVTSKVKIIVNSSVNISVRRTKSKKCIKPCPTPGTYKIKTCTQDQCDVVAVSRFKVPNRLCPITTCFHRSVEEICSTCDNEGPKTFRGVSMHTFYKKVPIRPCTPPPPRPKSRCKKRPVKCPSSKTVCKPIMGKGSHVKCKSTRSLCTVPSTPSLSPSKRDLMCKDSLSRHKSRKEIFKPKTPVSVSPSRKNLLCKGSLSRHKSRKDICKPKTAVSMSPSRKDLVCKESLSRHKSRKDICKPKTPPVSNSPSRKDIMCKGSLSGHKSRKDICQPKSVELISSSKKDLNCKGSLAKHKSRRDICQPIPNPSQSKLICNDSLKNHQTKMNLCASSTSNNIPESQSRVLFLRPITKEGIKSGLLLPNPSSRTTVKTLYTRYGQDQPIKAQTFKSYTSYVMISSSKNLHTRNDQDQPIKAHTFKSYTRQVIPSTSKNLRYKSA